MNPLNPSGERDTLLTHTLTREDCRKIGSLKPGQVCRLSNGQTVARADERPQRTGTGPTHVGAVRVRLSSDYSASSYAFHTDIPVAIGDTVDVEALDDVREGVVRGFGTGGYSGPLKSVVAVKAVTPS